MPSEQIHFMNRGIDGLTYNINQWRHIHASRSLERSVLYILDRRKQVMLEKNFLNEEGKTWRLGVTDHFYFHIIMPYVSSERQQSRASAIGPLLLLLALQYP